MQQQEHVTPSPCRQPFHRLTPSPAPCPGTPSIPASRHALRGPHASCHATSYRPDIRPSARRPLPAPLHASQLGCNATSHAHQHFRDSSLTPHTVSSGPFTPTPDRDLLRSTHGLLPHLAAKLLLDAALLRALPAVAYALPFYWIMGLRPTAAAFFTFLGAFVTMACLAGAPGGPRARAGAKRHWAV